LLSCNVLQDVAVPFMNLDCWEHDTLFLVFEEDYMFEYVEDEQEFIKGGALQEVVGVPAAQLPAEATPMTSSLAGPLRAASPHACLFVLFFVLPNVQSLTIF